MLFRPLLVRWVPILSVVENRFTYTMNTIWSRSCRYVRILPFYTPRMSFVASLCLSCVCVFFLLLCHSCRFLYGCGKQCIQNSKLDFASLVRPFLSTLGESRFCPFVFRTKPDLFSPSSARSFSSLSSCSVSLYLLMFYLFLKSTVVVEMGRWGRDADYDSEITNLSRIYGRSGESNAEVCGKGARQDILHGCWVGLNLFNLNKRYTGMAKTGLVNPGMSN